MIVMILKMMENEALKTGFLKLVNRSISASWLVLVVLLLRVILKKAPKWVDVLLWGIVAIRLICPFFIESAISLIPSTETIPMNIEMDATPAIDSGISMVNRLANPMISASFTPDPAASANPLQIWIPLTAIIWLLGMILMLLYTYISYWSLRRRVHTAVLYRDNIFRSEQISAPFVLGILNPRIYLPFHMKEQDIPYVIAHEQAHIRRWDHWWKPLGFLLLTLHWFNPLLWIAYVLLCRDIELACDERVVKTLDNERRADYTQTLVDCSVNRRRIAACPLAFGETDVKKRVKSIMNYRRPVVWMILLAVMVCMLVVVCFLTNPKQDSTLLRIVVPAGSQETFVYSDEEICAITDTIKIWSGDGLGDTEVCLLPVAGAREKSYATAYLTQGMPAVFDAENDIWFKVGVNMQNATDEDITVYVEAEKVAVRISSESTRLSLNDVIALSQYGYDLDWSDFAQFDYIETGSGLYIRMYEINERFQLLIGGNYPEGSPDKEPMYIYLTLTDNTDIKVDIRDGGVTEFISRHKSSSEEKWDLIPMVMVNGTLYFDTGHESTVIARCGMMDGEITSQVDGSEKPIVDDQSNFGIGYGYRYGATEGTIELCMNGKWWIFATEEVRAEMQSPSAEEELNEYYLTIGAEGVKRIELTMPNSSGGCQNADGSLFKKGDRIWLENLDGYNDLCGLTITALGENGEVIWLASIPDGEENKGFTHLTQDGWTITNLP